MDRCFAKKLGIKMIPLHSPLCVHALDGGPVGLEANKDYSVPVEYQDLAEAFSPMKATQLPPHCEWDCSKTLREGCTTVQNLPILPGGGAMHQGGFGPGFHSPLQFISPSASIFSVKKKDSRLRPCVDYRGLNELWIRRHYIQSILINSSFFDQHVHDIRAVLHTLLHNQLYCKLEKCEFHHREVSFLGCIVLEGPMRMQPCQVEAVTRMAETLDVPGATTVPGDANFCFIRSFGTLARPLTDLLQGQAKQLKWNSEAEKVFEDLKNTFSNALVLHQPEPTKPFVVEVDTLDVGVGAMPSQQTRKEGKLSTVAYFSCKLRLSERNCRITESDRELHPHTAELSSHGHRTYRVPMRSSIIERTLLVAGDT
ncbi:hypothetical protein P4O66_008085 [Electrophorus voltai]|uniref:Reverse transcriptase/retrotransposon-derived protein RNase H-like domain-containing protein n=1 Tax=Electrophorus voltai TaxID=2609070 RepID=A0AAD9DYJ8_9TELE|nr:hypothetical protein P4O66_008085 [Electrophorus voltai]